MKIGRPKIKAEDFLFYIAYGLFLIFGILSTSFYYKYFMSIYSLIKYGCIFLLIVRELIIHKYDIKGIIIGGVFVGIILITRTQGSMATVAYILIFVFCARNIEFKKIARFSAWVSLTIVAFIIASAYIGIIQNYVYLSDTRTRYYLGFRYALYGPVFLFNVTGLFVYVNKGNIRWVALFALLLANVWVYLMTDSRISFALSVLLIVISGFLKIFPNFFEGKRAIGFMMIFSFVFCFAISVYFTATYDSSVGWQSQLNNVLGDRLKLGHDSLREEGVSLFGHPLELVGNGLDADGHQDTTHTYNYVDSFYVQVLERYGIVFSAVWIGLLTYTLYCFYKRKDYYMMICLLMVAVHCVIDDLSLNLYYNTFWYACTIVMTNMSLNVEMGKEQDQKKESGNGIDCIMSTR